MGLVLPILALISGLGNVACRPPSHADSCMKNLLIIVLRFSVVTAKLCGAGGVRAVIAENLVLKRQLIVLRRGRQRSPNLALSDRLIGICFLTTSADGPGALGHVEPAQASALDLTLRFA